MAPKRKAKAQPEAKPSGTKKPRAIVRRVDTHCPTSGSIVDDYDVMLNQTNIGNNNNKFYVIQLLKCGSTHNVWTRWGRVGEPGQSALLGPFDLEAAKKAFCKKFQDKTKNKWDNRDNFEAHHGKYDLVKLKLQEAPPAAAAAASGTKKKGAATKAAGKKKTVKSTLSPKLQYLLEYIFTEAKQSLTTTIDANITENGIETPLGVLSVEQVEKGEDILDRLLTTFNGKAKSKTTKLQELSSEFYTAIPHRFGRQRPPVINTLEMIKSKSDLLELMKDMVNVTKENKGALFHDDLDAKYKSLGCTVDAVGPSTKEYKAVLQHVKESQEKSHGNVFVKVVNVYKVNRAQDRKAFNKKIGNDTRLYHGSRISNWVGLLSRGILLPKVVVSMGVKRTDPGWLGHGIYFGNADTAAGYAGQGKKGTAFMLAVNVALGKMKDYSKITYGLSSPPKGFQSCHGVAGTQFYDDEYVVYEQNQQHIEYLIEFKR